MVYSVGNRSGTAGHNEESGLMRGKLTLLAGVCAGAIAFPAYAQDAAGAEEEVSDTEIIVTAQRSNQRLPGRSCRG